MTPGCQFSSHNTIAGASGTSYVTSGQDAGRFVRLIVDARQGDGPVGSAASPATAITAKPVTPAPPTPTQTPAPPTPASPAQPPADAPTFIITKVVDTTTKVKMPDVRGLKIDAAEARIRAAGIYADVDQQSVTRPTPAKLNGRTLDVGDVSAQSVSPGTLVTSGIGTLRPLRLVTEAGAKATASNGGAFGDACVGKAVRDDLLRVELADVMDLLAAKRCTKVDLDFTVSSANKELEVRKATKGDGKLRLTVVVPGKADNMDLAVVLRQGAYTSAAPFGKDDWALTAGAANIFGVQAINRAGKTVDNAEVLVDGSGVDAADRRGPATGGIAVFGGFKPKRPGVVNVLVAQSDRNGNKIYGFRRFKVIKRTTGFTGIDGRRFDKDATPASGRRIVARSASGWDDFVAKARELARAIGLGAFFDARPPQEAISSAAKQNAGSAVLLGPPGVVASGGANVVASGGANAVAAGGANAVAAGGANAVAAGGANAVAAGGANAVAAGGANLLSLAKATAVAAGGANIIGRDLVANNRGTLFTTQNGSSLISDNGLGLISDNGLGLISDNGLG